MNRVMRKPVFCICENKDTNQLTGNRAADQRLCFHYKHSTIPLLPKSEISSLTMFCGCTAKFVSDLVKTPKTGFFVAKLNILTVTGPLLEYQYFKAILKVPVTNLIIS